MRTLEVRCAVCKDILDVIGNREAFGCQEVKVRPCTCCMRKAYSSVKEAILEDLKGAVASAIEGLLCPLIDKVVYAHHLGAESCFAEMMTKKEEEP